MCPCECLCVCRCVCLEHPPSSCQLFRLQARAKKPICLSTYTDFRLFGNVYHCRNDVACLCASIRYIFIRIYMYVCIPTYIHMLICKYKCIYTRIHKMYMCICLTLTYELTPCTATHCNTLQHPATHCNTLQHTALHMLTLTNELSTCTATHCNTLHCIC